MPRNWLKICILCGFGFGVFNMEPILLQEWSFHVLHSSFVCIEILGLKLSSLVFCGLKFPQGAIEHCFAKVYMILIIRIQSHWIWILFFSFALSYSFWNMGANHLRNLKFCKYRISFSFSCIKVLPLAFLCKNAQ